MAPLNGSYRRPSGSDGYPPAVGTLVVWTAARPIREAVAQSDAAGVVVYTIGNTAHLRKHGGHTGHRAGSKRGVLWACDMMIHDVEPARTRLLSYLRSNHDTRWISFVNFAGAQYNYAGQRVASSGDYHLHLEVRDGYENAATTATDLVRYVLTGKLGASASTTVKAQQVPKPKPPITPEEEDDMKLVKIDGLDPVYKSSGYDLTHIDRVSYDLLIKAGYKLTTYPKGTKLDALITAFGPVKDAAAAKQA